MSQQEAPAVLNNRYKVLNVLGAGGFGKTYLVEDAHMPSKERCVLKQLKPIHMETPELRQLIEDRFQREAATLEILGKNHNQIPRLYAYFSENEQFYLVEEWVKGPTLAQQVERVSCQTEQQVQAMVMQLLDVIAYIHAQKIIHRDIKPENVILRASDRTPVLIDFGAIKETMQTTVLSSGPSSQRTSQSIVVGTPGYMPSEQMAGRPLYATDLYSLGLTAIYALTGKHPQEFESDLQTGQLSWRQYAPDVSPRFADVLDRATQVGVRDRFSTAQEMHSAIASLNHQPAAGSPNTILEQRTTVYSPAGARSSNTSSEISANGETVVVSPGSSAASEPSFDPYSQPGATKKTSLWKGFAAASVALGLVVLGGGAFLSRAVQETSNASSEIASPPNTEAPSTPVVTESPELNASEEVVAAGSARSDDVQDSPSGSLSASSSNSPSEPQSEAQSPQLSPVQKTTEDTNFPGANATMIGTRKEYSVQETVNSSFSRGKVRLGERVQVLRYTVNEDGSPLYQILAFSGVQGWIPTQIVQLDGSRIVAPEGSASKDVVPQANATMVGTSKSYEIREDANSSFSRASVDRGARVRVINQTINEDGYPLYEVLVSSGKQGWVPKQVVQLDKGATISLPIPPSSIPQL